jgi:hypothetical protein
MANYQTLLGGIKKHLFDSLPGYFHLMDSNPDSEGKGSLQRFFEVFEDELVTSYGKIQDLLDNLHPLNLPESHLPLAGKHYSSPPTLFGDTPRYRRFLSGFKYLMQQKGAKVGLDNLFNLFNCLIELTDVTPRATQYDAGLPPESTNWILESGFWDDVKLWKDTQNWKDGPEVIEIDQQHDTPGVIHDYAGADFFFIDIDITDPDDYFSEFGVGTVKYQELINLIYFMLPINVFIKRLDIGVPPQEGYLLDHLGRILTTNSEQLIKAS